MEKPSVSQVFHYDLMHFCIDKKLSFGLLVIKSLQNRGDMTLNSTLTPPENLVLVLRIRQSGTMAISKGESRERHNEGYTCK